MRCPNCGAEVPNGHAYCTNCGASLPRNGGNRQNVRGQFPGEPGPGRGYDGGYDDGYGYDPYPPIAPQPQRSHAFLYVLIGFLSVLLIAIAILIVTSMNKDSKEEESEPEVQTVVVTPTPAVVTEAPTPAPETPTPPPTPTPTPAYSAEDEAAVKAVVGNYVYAYVADLNDETYSRLYSCVQAGSAFETERRNWINQSAATDLRETVLDYQVTNVQRQNANSYYVTSVETYTYYSNQDSTVKWVKQQCVYQIDRQSDGSWKISNLIGKVNVLGRGNY